MTVRLTSTAEKQVRRIVVGVDDSPASLVALVWATREAARREAVLEVVTAWPEAGAVLVHEVPGHFNLARDTAVRAQERALQRWADDGGVGGSTLVRQVDNAHPAEALVSRSSGADLLVVGAPRPRAGRAASVAELCDLFARCPVVVVDGERSSRDQ